MPKKLKRIASAEAVSTENDMDGACMRIDQLPDEILVQIFSYMSFSELLDLIQKVCFRWRTLSHSSLLWANKEYLIESVKYLAETAPIPGWAAVDLARYSCFYTCRRCEQFNSFYTQRHTSNSYLDSKKIGASDKEVKQTFHSAPNLRIVRMRRPVNMRIFRELYENCHNLAVLELHRTQHLPYNVLENLVERCSSIHTLTISNELLKSKEVSEAISQLQHLRVLIMDLRPKKSTPVLQPLGDGCPQLSELCFRFEEIGQRVNIDINDLKYFLNAKKNTLKSLSMWGEPCPKWLVVPLLGVCAGSLERLHLHAVQMIPTQAKEAFTALGRLKNLEDLGLTITEPPPTGTFALAFKAGGLPKLRNLNLPHARGLEDDAVVAVCRGCPALMELRITYARRLSDAAFSEIDRLQNLEVLEVSHCVGLRSSLIPYLGTLPRLKSLSLVGMDFLKLQPGVSSILELSTVSSLVLRDSIITVVPFNEFPEKLINLRELNIVACRGDRSGLDGLTERMPGLRIYW